MSIERTVIINLIRPYVLTDRNTLANFSVRLLIQRRIYVSFGFFPETSNACEAQKVNK
jgi:hypothetical protein